MGRWVLIGATALTIVLGVASQQRPAEAQARRSRPAPAEAPAPTARELERARLRDELLDITRRPPLAGARLGVHVVSLDTGEVLFAHDERELLNPASNVKLVTSATALARLGPEYRFATEFSCAQPVSRGACKTLYIKGKGDPSLYTERLYGIAGELLHRGLRKVGDIVVDDTFFDDERDGPGWEQELSDKPYMAPAGALSVNHNAIGIFVAAGDSVRAKARIELEPRSDYFKVENHLVTAPRKSRRRVIPSSLADGDRQRIVVRGRLPVGRETSVYYKKIHNPPMYAGETFKAIFNERGLAVRGKVRRGPVPADAEPVFTSYSRPLADIVRELNKFSNNFIAEQLLKTLGAETRGPPGSWAKGVDAVEEYLAELGIPRGSYVMKNGSGLNDVNRFSAAQMTRLLTAVHDRSGFFPEYAASLGVAGRDGTVRSRLEGTAAVGRLRAKTGTLENVTALSGYVRLASGETYAYSILANDFPSRHGPAIAQVDALAAAMASGGRAGSEPYPPLLREPSDVEPGELRARVVTFSNLGKVADTRNLPFLRSALRTETDPVLRAVVADAIFRSDPESGAGVLLENAPASPQVFARLRALGQELSMPTPLVSSLIDLAAEGSAEALDRLLTLAGQAKDDHSTSALLADGLQEIGRTAPDELYEALRRAGDDGAGALALLEQGIAESEEKGTHPFLERLKTLPEVATGLTAVGIYEHVQQALSEVGKPVPAPAPVVDVAPVSAPASGSSERPGGG